MRARFSKCYYIYADNHALKMFNRSTLGIFSAIFSATFMASQRITSRRGMVGDDGVSPSVGVMITMVVALCYLGVLVIMLGKVEELLHLNPLTLLSLGAAGIIHFMVGRTCSYNAFKYVGVNTASPYISMNSFYAISFGSLFLKERPSFILALGALFILSGVIVITIFKPRLSSKDPIKQRHFRKGLLFALCAGLSFGSSAPLIRLGLMSSGSPIIGPFTSYMFALLVYLPIMLVFGKLKEIRGLRFEESKYFLFSGVFVNTAHVLRYVALAFLPLWIAAPLLSSNEVFSFLFSSLLIRKYELFNRPIIAGIALSIIGVILVALANIR